jgi:uncharacterized paraquat-inducible protein A
MGKNEKNLVCDCGHAFASDQPKAWCPRCGRPVFADPAQQRNQRIGHYMIWAVFLSALTFVVYLFVEMIAKPLLG